jgi:predicted RNA-binding Zn-ribbon protein involved in translation (DUF1610 family)
MPNVTCPSCSTRQEIVEGAESYTCTSCGRVWEFVVCESCGSRFHAKPGTTEWTCPTCGTAHPRVASPQPVAISGDDLEAVPTEAPGGPLQPGPTTDPGTVFPMPRAERTGWAGWAGKVPTWAWVAVVAVVVVAIAAVVLTRGGGSTPEASGSATEAMCAHVGGLQELRTDALGRAQDDLKADAAALKAEGSEDVAKQVKKLIAAIGAVRTDLQNQDPTTKSFAAMNKAIAALPC